MKKSTQSIVISALLTLIITQLASCGNDDCPDIKQPPIQDLTEFEKQRFPYDTIDQLAFYYRDERTIDTLVYEKIDYVQKVVGVGDSIDMESGCKQKFMSRHAEYIAKYKHRKSGHIIEFFNDADITRIGVNWIYGYVSSSHGSLDKKYGGENQISLGDTVTLLDSIVFEKAFRSYTTQPPLKSSHYAYSYPIGFIYLGDKQNNKEWFLLDWQ
ncbi:MAG: hypothetical protein KDC92_09705 [Bacteroidetes bacterium]|nr:hypothetical protein [Bacteroidota bacterium]